MYVIGIRADLQKDRHDATTASIKKPIHNVKEQAIHGPRTGYGVIRAGICCLHLWRNARVVEPIGIEPMTPCLQSRCSPS
jgi:hypothetical protein